MSLFNNFHPHDPKKDTSEVCDWIDAGVFSGDLLHTCDLEEFKKYIERWGRAIKDHEKCEIEQNSHKDKGL